ncbi:MAG TPA: hypothetical protein VKO45_04940 [Methanomicrobiales archaeon]|nr:hypothetical protein [Methanomicrobiales archaeon]
MDRTLSVVLAALVVASVIFLAVISLTAYIGITYRDTLSSTYEFRVSITPDATLRNVTLYLPVPVRGSGPSAVLEGIGTGKLTGVPGGWNVSLIGTEKFTYLEVWTREISPLPDARSYELAIDERVTGPIDTKNAGSGDLVLAPAAAMRQAACTGTDGGTSPDLLCEQYESPVYADFTSPGNAHLRIFISLSGRNTWDVFGPSSNEYQDGLQVSFSEGAQGWRPGSGMLVTGIGDYGLDPWLQGEGTG